jgi:5-methylcytosine-specific restriction endonuclease McrA
VRPPNPFYLSRFWRLLRLERLRLDRYICQGCMQRRATTVDHVITRPPVPYPCELDRIDNLRSLCDTCDRQVKETRGGKRRNEGRFRLMGCDINGLPFDPRHRR